jgi:hypothetical protein
MLATLALAVAAPGCGDGSPSDEAAVRAKVVELRDATRDKRYDRLCGRILAAELVREVRSTGLTCEAAMESALGDVRDPSLVIGAIRVADDRATAEIRTSAAGQSPSRDVVELVRTAAGWRVTSLG